jgi:hypothetical protein
MILVVGKGNETVLRQGGPVQGHQVTWDKLVQGVQVEV